jgi:hypothetical protein
VSFPKDRYTPHGYLDNPYHTRNLNPSGVIRSTPGVGFGWHYPALGRSYGYREIYHASLNLALVVGGALAYRQEDFSDLHASYHSKNVFAFAWRTDALEGEATFHPVGEHTLACRVKLTLTANTSAQVRLVALGRYTRHLGAAGVWGESGLVGRIEDGKVVLQGFEDGEAFVLGAGRAPDVAGVVATCDEAWLRARFAHASNPAMPDADHVTVTGERGESVTLHGAAAYDVQLEPEHPLVLELLLSRGIRRDLALKEHASALLDKDIALAALLEEDRRFWSAAPRLEGDWPGHWRRGFVYDFETLRMMVRRPIGIYKHAWDAMQIQAPRVVLAEAAIDALLLAYADAATARELLLGTFLDAPQANVPCSREDGSYNMVGASGSECGTAPEWGYPVEVVDYVYRLDPQPQWLAAIYPKLAEFLEWWLTHRRDDEGYLVYDNSWESGQDLSSRFGPQKQGGGSMIRMVRPVDLQAAMTGAFKAMKGFAAILGRHEDVERWRALEVEFRNRVESLWHEGAYRDYDARVGWSDVWDIMQLAPVALGVVPEERVQALSRRIAGLDKDVYLWPMFVWTATDAALIAGNLEVANRIAAATIDRAYRYWDAPTHEERKPLPGVTCEYWGVGGHCGAEGYGWGAFGVHLLLRTIIGFRPRPDGAFSLAPNLPRELLRPGKTYRLNKLPYHGASLDIGYHILEEGLTIQVRCRGATLRSAAGEGSTLEWRGEQGATYVLQLLPEDEPA